jgi:hypothetical protein
MKKIKDKTNNFNHCFINRNGFDCFFPFPQDAGPAFHATDAGVYMWHGGKLVETLEHETIERIDEGLGRAGK